MKKNRAAKSCADAVTEISKVKIVVETYKDDWSDPREKKERRQAKNTVKIPPSGCRRNADRRVTRYVRDDQWWLHRGYNKGEKL